MRTLVERQREFEERWKGLSPVLRQKEMERLAIDLSWKSSQIEGNTYTALQTESLFKEGKRAKGKIKEEAVMLLNHQAAMDYILNKPGYFGELTVQKILEIHRFLTKGLGIPNKSPVRKSRYYRHKLQAVKQYTSNSKGSPRCL